MGLQLADVGLRFGWRPQGAGEGSGLKLVLCAGTHPRRLPEGSAQPVWRRRLSRRSAASRGRQTPGHRWRPLPRPPCTLTGLGRSSEGGLDGSISILLVLSKLSKIKFVDIFDNKTMELTRVVAAGDRQAAAETRRLRASSAESADPSDQTGRSDQTDRLSWSGISPPEADLKFCCSLKPNRD